MNKLKTRNELKRKKPTFRRQDSHKKVRVSPEWRRPKGSDSKMRRHQRGYLRSPEIGWGSPKEVKGLLRNGLRPVLVSNLKDLEKLDEKCSAVISSGVGRKKKMDLVKKLLEMKITITDIKDGQKYLEKSEELFKKRKEENEALKKKKEVKKKEKEKKAKKEAKKEELEEKVDAEDKKKEEVKEKEKILTKKE